MTPRERTLERQLRDTQAALPQAQLEAMQANTARDQAEATLRNVQADLGALVTTVVAAYPDNSGPLDPTLNSTVAEKVGELRARGYGPRLQEQ